jgi:hypothetical protein
LITVIETFSRPYNLGTWQTILVLAVFFVLAFKREFWFVAFTLGSLAAGAEALAYLMRFQLTSTFGFALLAAACWALATGISSGNTPGRNKVSHIPRTSRDHPDWSPH